MLQTEYETTVVIRPDVSGDTVEAILDRVRGAITTSGGKLLAVNHWGKRKLAYEIEKITQGIYVHSHYLGQGGLVSEIERQLRLSDKVLRYLTVRLAERVQMGDREVTEYVRPEYDAVVAAADDDEVEGQSADADADQDDGDAGASDTAAEGETVAAAADEAEESQDV